MMKRLLSMLLAAFAASALLGCEDANVNDSHSSDGDTDGDSDGDSDADVDTDADADADADSDGDTDTSNNEECGEAGYTGDPLAIPDGDVEGLSYETTMTISGFGDGATLPSVDKFIAVCVNMEHSWIRDLQIEMIPPGGEASKVILNEYLGKNGSEVFLGIPNENDEEDPPIPGVGYTYCWTPNAVNPPMLEWANQHPFQGTVPEGDYQASSGFDILVGKPLNGAWTLRCTDDWAIDNGYIFWWSLEFDSSLIPDCDEWIIE